VGRKREGKKKRANRDSLYQIQGVFIRAAFFMHIRPLLDLQPCPALHILFSISFYEADNSVINSKRQPEKSRSARIHRDMIILGQRGTSRRSRRERSQVSMNIVGLAKRKNCSSAYLSLPCYFRLLHPRLILVSFSLLLLSLLSFPLLFPSWSRTLESRIEISDLPRLRSARFDRPTFISLYEFSRSARPPTRLGNWPRRSKTYFIFFL
jgi:hypothetical protein